MSIYALPGTELWAGGTKMHRISVVSRSVWVEKMWGQLLWRREGLTPVSTIFLPSPPAALPPLLHSYWVGPVTALTPAFTGSSLPALQDPICLYRFIAPRASVTLSSHSSQKWHALSSLLYCIRSFFWLGCLLPAFPGILLLVLEDSTPPATPISVGYVLFLSLPEKLWLTPFIALVYMVVQLFTGLFLLLG